MGDEREYRSKGKEQREDNHIPPGEPILILEVDVDTLRSSRTCWR
jgi:hypothetical protein